MMTLRVLQNAPLAGAWVLQVLLYCTQLLYGEPHSEGTLLAIWYFHYPCFPHRRCGRRDFRGERWEQTRTVCIPSQRRTQMKVVYHTSKKSLFLPFSPLSLSNIRPFHYFVVGTRLLMLDRLSELPAGPSYCGWRETLRLSRYNLLSHCPDPPLLPLPFTTYTGDDLGLRVHPRVCEPVLLKQPLRPVKTTGK